ncbi:MAG: hypothetical protein QOJ89_2310 [bacterium]
MSQIAIHIPTDAGLPGVRPRYVPLLLDRSGERRALRHADEATWASMTPLIAVARYGPPPTRGALKSRAKALHSAVGERPFYLDLEGIAASRRVATPGGERETLAVLHEEAARRGLAFMPVARSTDGPRRLAMVAAAVREHGRGFALRHRLGSRLQRTGEGPADRLLRTVEAVGAAPGGVDLILDLGWLDPDSGPSARWVAQQIQALSTSANWRSVILAATCVPQSISGIADLDAVGSIPRVEWLLWKDVASRTDVEVIFADYAVQHPRVPSSGGRTFGNLRYTADHELYVSRGHLISNMDGADFAAMCSGIVVGGPFCGSDYSWGDEQIHRLAQLRRGPRVAIFDDPDDEQPIEGIGSHPFWRAVGTSHHLKFVSVQLAGHCPVAN